MWGNKVSNQTATRRTAQTRVTYAVLVLCGVTATAAIHAISQPAETPPNTARFEVTSVNTPVIVRGTSGAQTITVQNKGPDAATGTQALIRPSTSTGITIASVTWGASNTPCTFSSPDYTCSVGGVANNASFDITVTYNVATTATASTSVKQTEIRVKSNEFNPGSGAGETIHKVWGALNQENPATEFGAFWAGRTSNSATCNGRGTTCGTFAGENTDVLGAWPKDSENPVGEYLQSSVNNTGNDNYKVSGTKKPTYNRIVADMPSYNLNQLTLPTVSGTGNRINNRRAWEFRTYVYIPPNKSTAKFCVGADGIWVDDNAYITLSPSGSSSRTVVSTPRDAWSNNIYQVSTGGISGGGYYELIYRIVNQNAGGSDEEAQGGYGKIGMAFDGDACNVTNFDNAIEAGFPASITIANPTVDLSIAKSNGVTSVNAGASTAYSIVVSNTGPDAANGALFRDVAATGLNKTSITCTAAGGAACPTSPTVAQAEAGLAIPTLPNGGSVTFNVNATVTAITGSVSNVATVTAPAGVTEIDTANNTATDTDTVTPAVDLSVVKSQRAGTTGAFQTSNLSVLVLGTVQYQLVLTNNGPSSVTAATLSDSVPAQFNTVSVVSATGANGATACSASNTGNNVSGTWSGPSGATCTVVIQARAGLTTGTYTNTATTAVPSGTVETNNANNSSSVQTAIAPAADLAIVKTQRIGTTGAFVGTALSVNQLQTVQYQLVLTNNGPTTATAATYTDAIPANITGLTVVGTPTTTGIGTVCAAPTFIGQTLNGTFTAAQNGTCTVTVQGTATTTGSITNTATITAVGVTDTVAGNNSSSVDMTIILAADLSITKTGTQSANSGSLVSYVIRVTNNGAIDVNGAVINDTLPAGLSNAYWNCVVPIDGVFATTANIGTRTDEVCISPATSATTLRQTSSVIAQTVNLPAGQSVEIRVIGRANGGMLSNTASVTVPTGITDPNLTNNTTAAVNTSVLSALDVASCNAVKMIDANGLLNSPVAWPVQQGTITPTVSFNRSGTFDINRTHTAPSVSTGTAPNPMVIGLGTDRTTKTSSTTWSWTATFSQPVPLNQIYMYLTDLNSFDPTVTLSLSGGTATLANLSGYSSNHGGAAQELVFDQSNGQIIRAFNRNTGSAAADSNPRGSMVLLSSSSNTVTSITLSSTNTITGDNIGIDFGARVGCDYGDAPDTFGNPRAGVLSSYLQMGASIPDTEAAPAIPRNFTGDDVTGRDDEDIINVTPQLNIVDTSFSLNGLSVLNTTEGAATLRGWIDVNGNGVVDAGEQATVAVPSNASAQTVSLNWPSLPTLTVGSKLLRFTLLDDTNSFFGEIEDHQLEVLGLAQITGRVFTDNSGTTGIAANAYNGIQNTGELGLAGSTVELNNCAGAVITTTQTDGMGDYSFGVLLTQLSTPNFCITQTNLASYSSVSGTAGYVRATDTITVVNTGVLSYTGHNFGDARLNLVLTSDGQQTTTPSGTVSYPHILRSESVLDVGLLSTVSTENPTLGWTTVLYRDDNCNGTIDAGEQPLTTAIGQMFPGDEVCVVQRVNAPSTASNGAQHVATLSASYTATVQDSGVLSGSSNTRIDTTLVGTAGLDMRKQVRVVEQCLPTVIAGAEPFTDRNTAQNGHFLEYEIIYTNRSTRNLSQLTVRDVAPSSTTFQSATCQSTPSGSSCTAPVSAGVNGDLAWSLTNIPPAATGSVRFCVQVPPLAEPPIQ